MCVTLKGYSISTFNLAFDFRVLIVEFLGVQASPARVYWTGTTRQASWGSQVTLGVLRTVL